MSGVVAHFYVSEVTKNAWDRGAKKVTLQAVSRGDKNREWASATPSGTITMQIKNGPAADWFEECFDRGSDVELYFKALPKEE